METLADQVVRNLVQALNGHDLDGLTALYAADYEGNDSAEPKPQQGPQSIRQSLTGYLQAFPDLELELVQAVLEENHAALHWIGRGTHQGTIMNIPPTGRHIAVAGTWFLTLSDGKIVRATTIWDVAGMLRALGLLPEL